MNALATTVRTALFVTGVSLAVSAPAAAADRITFSEHIAPIIYNKALLQGLGTTNIFSASTVDQMPKHVSAGLMFGTPITIPIPDIDHTDLLVMLGANPFASNGSLMTAPDLPGRLRAIRARGGRIVCIDPRRSKTAEE